MRKTNSKGTLLKKRSSVLTNTYADENLKISDKEEWKTPKQRKKANIKSSKSLTNTDSNEHRPSRTRLFKQSIYYIFKQIPYNNSI